MSEFNEFAEKFYRMHAERDAALAETERLKSGIEAVIASLDGCMSFEVGDTEDNLRELLGTGGDA